MRKRRIIRKLIHKIPKRIRREIFYTVLILAAAAIFMVYKDGGFDNLKIAETAEQYISRIMPENKPKFHTDNTLIAHFIDVGQGDSTYIQLPDGKNMLIDSGEYEYENTVTSYLREQGCERIDYLVATHPHTDHMGCMAGIIHNFEIGGIYMPDAVNNTAAFEKMLDEIERKNLSVYKTVRGMEISGSDEYKITVLSPEEGEQYDDLNNYSIVLKLTFGNTSFMFTGDAETKVENSMLESGMDLSADVLKVGHHGSSSSSSYRFLEAVNLRFAVISVGKDNSYNHPNGKVLERIKRFGTKVYRTDQDGTVVMVSDGNKISVK